MIIPSHSSFIQIMNKYGYAVFLEKQNKPFNLNIVGYRNQFGRPNFFDDTIAVYYQEGGKWIERFYEATTRPGTPHLFKPENPKGTAILVPGQYQYRLGIHKKKYPALVQALPVQVYRDKNKDCVYDIDSRTVEEGFFGINIHRASFGAKLVGADSAGCQVIRSSSDFEELIELCRKASNYYGNNFTYTLVDI